MPVELKPFSWARMIAAVEAVKERTLRAARALEIAGIPDAIAGGNAVAAWVARVDIKTTAAEISKANTLLDWHPKTDLEA